MATKTVNPALATLEALKSVKITTNLENEKKLSAPNEKTQKSIESFGDESILCGRSFKISKTEEGKISKIRRSLEDTIKIRLSDNIVVRLAIARLSNVITSEELEMIRELVSQDKRRKK